MSKGIVIEINPLCFAGVFLAWIAVWWFKIIPIAKEYLRRIGRL
jgi:hypothetical protein